MPRDSIYSDGISDIGIEHPHGTVAHGSAIRIRFFDEEGAVQTSVHLSTMSVGAVRDAAGPTRRALEAYFSVLGYNVIDITVDLEVREQLLGLVGGQFDGPTPSVRGARFLQLSTVHGRNMEGQAKTLVDILIDETDTAWEPTSIWDLAPA